MIAETASSGTFERAELDRVRSATAALLQYCRARDWAGYDPYDAVNAQLFQWLPFLNHRWPRLVLTQTLKRSPINIRPLIGVRPTQNPKALALFLSALIKLSRQGFPETEELIPQLRERILALRSPGEEQWCWGYSFPWQTRSELVPRGAPNLVCSYFVGTALLDLFDFSADKACLEIAVSTASYFVEKLYCEQGDSAGFSYPFPGKPGRVHNANLLAAAFLCRVAQKTGESRFLEPALKVARWSAGKQKQDGSWVYGEGSKQQWIDNFHTGFNLCALHDLENFAAKSEFNLHLRKGFEFYCLNFFGEHGEPKYFHDRIYPLDVHSAAQSLITLLQMRDLHPSALKLAQSVLSWTLEQLRDPAGFFYYQSWRWFTNTISYMRWSQAWMLLALATVLEAVADGAGPGEKKRCGQSSTRTCATKADPWSDLRCPNPTNKQSMY